MNSSRAFHAPSAIITGAGCRHQLVEYLAGMRSVLLVTDPFLIRSGVIQPIVDQLAAASIAVTLFDVVQPDPTDSNVAAGVHACVAAGAEAIVAIGGGSPIDAAKVIAASCANPGPLDRFQGYNRISNAGLPVIAIPTTAGTGSEATKVAVITDTTRQIKMMMLDAKLMPRFAFVDHELSSSMPRPLTAHVGVDTLTHGIEAFVSRKANAMSDPLAESAIRLCARHLRRAWIEGSDGEAREGMSIAALQGGMAFTNSSVCLVHGMSRPLGAVFHLAHGLSNAVLLPAVTRFSIPGAPARYAHVARMMGVADGHVSDEAACAALITELERLNRDLEVPSLSDCLQQNDVAFRNALPKMAADALASGSPENNPRVPSEDEIIALYEQIWQGAA